MADETRVVQDGEWRAALAAARDEGYAFFDWLSAVDRSDDDATPGVDLTAHLLDTSTPGALRGILLVCRVPDGEAVESVTGVYAGAAWHERETHEMFGVGFTGFDDGSGLGLRPLLLPDGFEGTPLRKSFQLAARASKPWPGAKEPGEGHESATSTTRRRRVQAPGVPPPEWGPR
ncbi:MAG TPA: NADH-quinone oxidoreductase subunit C [Ornithinibacter sp.]|nr:NADH-quinone oxidoreductase subunit C [Ornithinibacter sp.]